MQRDAGYYECQAFNKHAVETKVGWPLKFIYCQALVPKLLQKKTKKTQKKTKVPKPQKGDWGLH